MLRDLARRVLQSQNDGWPEEPRNEARRALGRAYDRFAAAYGPINKTTFTESKTGTVRRMPNLVKFREDPDAMLVMSLEDYDELSGKAAKAAIMARDVVGRRPPVTAVTKSRRGGRTARLRSTTGRRAWTCPIIADRSTARPESQVIEELGVTLIYLDPETLPGRRCAVRLPPLGRRVRAKLAAAERAGPDFARNAEALRAVQPEDVLPGDIDANLGAPWIPEADIQAASPRDSVQRRTLGDPGRAPSKKDAALWSPRSRLGVRKPRSRRPPNTARPAPTARGSSTWP